MTDIQKVKREELQILVNSIYAAGGELDKIKLRGNWHGIHNGQILKSPFPLDSQTKECIYTFKNEEEELDKSILMKSARDAADVLFYSDTTEACLLDFTHKENGYEVKINITKE